MDLCWTAVSLLLDCAVAVDGWFLLVLAKLYFYLQSSNNENFCAACSGLVFSPHHILPENLCFQHSKFWGIQGKQQEGHGNSSKGTRSSAWRAASLEEWTTDVSLLQPLQILSRCDLCLIQEVRDSKGEAVQALVKDLNRSELFCRWKFPVLKSAHKTLMLCRQTWQNWLVHISAKWTAGTQELQGAIRLHLQVFTGVSLSLPSTWH